ncbi:hypothetical protein [Salibacter halophilus]|uniref:Lipoprotein n=1 Tax=Salibacter halophilus TaxID=1803916 RepID=A0A6N6MAN6_9FLAO|nr:hypothetical protein [Salibacter halophilus]KAB1066059.1 hypothetical protein F3059_00905 [Salibacter halophilus]
MKNFKSLGWLALSALLVFSSCNKDDDDDEPQPQPKPTESYSVTVGDEDFEVGKVLDSFMVASQYRTETSVFSSTIKENIVTIQMFGQQGNNSLEVGVSSPYRTTEGDNPGVEKKSYTREGDDCIEEGNSQICDRFEFVYTKYESNGTTTVYTFNSKSAYGSMEITRFDTNNKRVTAVFDAMAYTSDESDSIKIEGEAKYVPFEMY